jgi:hypothetical protein
VDDMKEIEAPDETNNYLEKFNKHLRRFVKTKLEALEEYDEERIAEILRDVAQEIEDEEL